MNETLVIRLWLRTSRPMHRCSSWRVGRYIGRAGATHRRRTRPNAASTARCVLTTVTIYHHQYFRSIFLLKILKSIYFYTILWILKWFCHPLGIPSNNMAKWGRLISSVGYPETTSFLPTRKGKSNFIR